MLLAERLAAGLEPGDVLLLYGELGAGKTCFVRGLARGLGIDPANVSSPTFVLVQEYGPAGGRPPLLHIDAYRLTSPEDLASAGVEDLLASDAIVAVEWPQRLGEDLPEPRLVVRFDHISAEVRGIELSACGGDRFLARARTLYLDAVAQAAP